MKKRTLTLFLTLFALSISLLGLSACGDKGCKHLYHDNTTNPTCTERGYTTYTCELCGDSYVDNYVPALNHGKRNWVGEEPAIPGVSDGVIGHFECLDCGIKLDDQGNELTSVVLHSFSEWVPAQAPTCTVEGTAGFYFCMACEKFFDANKNEISENEAIIPKTSHSFSEWIEEVPATCKAQGNIAYGHCSVCNFVYDAQGNKIQNMQDVVIDYANHTLGTWIEEVASTCKEEGVLGHYACSVCEKDFDINENELTSLTIAKNNNHSYGTWIEEVPSTCKQEGVLGHYTCSVCEKDFDVNKNELNSLAIATEHKYELGYCKFCTQPKINYDLAFTLSGDGTYYVVSGMGDCEDAYITIPSEYEALPVKEIGESAFVDCTNLISVSLPNTIKTVGASAFKYCNAITSFTMSSEVESIGSQAFYGCHGITQITIPKSVTSIGLRAFDLCKGLKRIDVNSENAVYSSNSGVLYNKDATVLLCYPGGKTETDFDLPMGVTEISNYAFSYTYNLRTVNFARDVEKIGDNAFSNSHVNIVNFTDDSKLTEIGANAFYWSEIIKITIPQGVTSIGSSAFTYSEKLMEVYNKSSISIDSGTYGIYAKNIYTPISGASKISFTSDGYVIYTDGANKRLVGYVGDATTLVLPSDITIISWYALRYSNATSVTIPANVKTICDGAFNNCYDLTEIKYNATNCDDNHSSAIAFMNAGKNSGGIKLIIGANVTKIPDYMFARFNITNYAHIKEVVFEEGSVCASIGDSAFSGCEKLTSIVIPSCVTSIGKYAFSYCLGLTDIIIPNGIETIGQHVFDTCENLKNITISESVTAITDAAFTGCRNVKNIYYMGDEESWGLITIDNWSKMFISNAQRYYYSQTEPTTAGNYWHYVDGVPTAW